MKLPFLYPIVNFTAGQEPLPYIQALLEAGAEIVQLRGKSISQTEFLEIAKAAVALKNAQYPRAKIIINDSVEIAKEADGVHLGQEDTAPQMAREILGKNAFIGLSTHNIEQIKNAPIEHLSYLALGPIFDSKTKSGHAPEVGLGTLEMAKTLTTLPLVAIGGIQLSNAAKVYKAGADCIANISDFETNNDLKKLITDYQKAFKSFS